MENIEMKFDQFKAPYYEELPPNFVVASPEDFYQKVAVNDDEGNCLRHETRLKLKFAFLIHSFHFEMFWAYRVKENFEPDKIAPWFEAGKVYIWKNDL